MYRLPVNSLEGTVTAAPDLPGTSRSPTNALNPPGSSRRHFESPPRGHTPGAAPRAQDPSAQKQRRRQRLGQGTSPSAPSGAFLNRWFRNEPELSRSSPSELWCAVLRKVQRGKTCNYPSPWGTGWPPPLGVTGFNSPIWGGA